MPNLKHFSSRVVFVIFKNVPILLVFNYYFQYYRPYVKIIHHKRCRAYSNQQHYLLGTRKRNIGNRFFRINVLKLQSIFYIKFKKSKIVNIICFCNLIMKHLKLLQGLLLSKVPTKVKFLFIIKYVGRQYRSFHWTFVLYDIFAVPL